MSRKFFQSILLYPFIAILLTSCVHFEDIKIGQPQNIQVQGFEENFLKINVDLPIDNPTIHRIQIKEIDVRVFINKQYIGKLLVDEKILINPKKSEVYKLPVKIRLANLFNTAFIMMDLRKGNQVDFRFEGKLKIKTMLITKSVPVDETRKVIM